MSSFRLKIPKLGSLTRVLALSTKMAPLTVQPRLISLKNRYYSNSKLALADLLVLAVTSLLMIGLYLTTHRTLGEWSKLSTRYENSSASNGLPLTIPLEGICIGLFGLILLSACVTSIGALFIAKDIELLLTAPISVKTFLRGKVTQVGFGTTWMVCVFSIPPYLAFGHFNQAGFIYYLCAPILLGSFLLMAVMSGALIAILVSAVLPAKSGRNIFAALFIIALSLFISSLNATPGGALLSKLSSLSNSSLNIPTLNHPALPSTWLAAALRSLLSAQTYSAISTSFVFIFASFFLWRILILACSLLHSVGYSKLQSSTSSSLLSRTIGGRAPHSLRIFSRATGAIISKEFLTFSRDLTHTIQLGMLLTICVIYLIAVGRINPPTHVGVWVLRIWDLMAIGGCLMISSFITLSICGRFVYPSISLEGQSLWLLQTAPVTPRELLRAKYTAWIIPTSTISCVVFASGGLALALHPIWLCALLGSAVALSHGLVAVGLACGAKFSRFDWEHPTELSTSWGHLIFILSGFFVIVVSLIPLIITFSCYILLPSIFRDYGNLITLVISGLCVLIAIQFIIGRVALRLGTQALTGALARTI